jgi:Tfp pilus assembly protein PilZ
MISRNDQGIESFDADAGSGRGIGQDVQEETRLFQRFDAQFPVKFKDTREDFGTTVFLRDASAQGARLTTKEHLYINDNISLEVKLPGSDNPMNLKGKVVWTKISEPNVWEVGLKFHEISLMHMARMYKYVAPLQSS